MLVAFLATSNDVIAGQPRKRIARRIAAPPVLPIALTSLAAFRRIYSDKANLPTTNE